jgi:glycogen debranching enzyme
VKDATPLEEAIRVGDRWYVLATGSGSGDPARALKHGESFALFDRFGDIPLAGSGEHGLYHQGTRMLSLYELRIAGQRPTLLNSSVRRDNGALNIDGTNPDYLSGGELSAPRGTVHLSRAWTLWTGAAHERIELANFGLEPIVLQLTIEFGADYADIFEVRGFQRARRGRDLQPEVRGDRVLLGYQGLDGVTRRTELSWSTAPAQLTAARAAFIVALDPHGRFELESRACCMPGERPAPPAFVRACTLAESALREASATLATVKSSNEQFDAWIGRSASDIAMLTAGNPEGPYPYAGVPWYSVPFGRDGIITAMQYLWADSSMARGVLEFLAATQATEFRPEQDAEPGKIVHEMRKGELAALGEIPFGRYYGTIDATPLFVMLAGEHYQRTGDRDTLQRLWPAIERALGWIEEHGDLDGDGYIEYQRRSATGLANQGWKDSEDAVFHADGRLAEGPIALCEVQGYAYAARIHAARLARSLGHEAQANELERRAAALRERFERDFWVESLGTYALALDGEKRPCEVYSSNAGHVLWSGIASHEHAQRVGEALLAPHSFGGWGVRTVANCNARYNPMSYHNGSVWPHDNAIVAMGLARYGLKDKTRAIAGALYDASLFMDLHRLPELYCGFARRHHGEGPTLYPVACSPQAWASASPFYLLKACLGLSFRPEEPRIRLLHPALPAFLDRLELCGLRAGDAVVDIGFERHGDEVAVKVKRTQGDVEISVVH